MSMYASFRASVRLHICAHVRACVRAHVRAKLCEPMQTSSHAKCHNVTSKIYLALYDGPVPGNWIVFHCSCSVGQPMYVAFSSKTVSFYQNSADAATAAKHSRASAGLFVACG